MASPTEPAQEPTPSSPPKPPPLQRTSTFSERLKKSSIPLLFRPRRLPIRVPMEKTILRNLKRSLHRRRVRVRPKERNINLRETRIRRPGESFYSRRKRVQHVHTDDRFRLEPNRIEEEVPRVREEQVRNVPSRYPVGTTSKNEIRSWRSVPLNPLILSVGAIGVMKEIGHASETEREVKPRSRVEVDVRFQYRWALERNGQTRFEAANGAR